MTETAAETETAIEAANPGRDPIVVDIGTQITRKQPTTAIEKFTAISLSGK